MKHLRKYRRFTEHVKSSPSAIVFISLFAAIGILTLVLTHAATSTPLSFEPENGFVNGVAVVSNNTASQGQAVKFGANNSTANNGTDTSCVFQKAVQPVQQAFCDGFNSATVNPAGSRSGDLNGVLWGVSRVGDQFSTNSILPPLLQGCGADIVSVPPANVRVCNGRMLEAQDDNHAVVQLTTYPKQPFDFANRTGTVVFDVSADAGGSHAAWPEFVITDKPNPGVRIDISEHNPPAAAYQIGFSMSQCGNDVPPYPDATGVDAFYYTNNHVWNKIVMMNGSGKDDCIHKATGPTGGLNHFEVQLTNHPAVGTQPSLTDVKVWASDPGGANLRQIAHVDNLNLGFTKGLVWLNDAHYNARKGCPCPPGNGADGGPQYVHTFSWDNLGFDGPKTYRDLSFDVPDAHIGPNSDGTYYEGYALNASGVTLSTLPVYRNKTPASALVTFVYYSFGTNIPTITLNSGSSLVGTPTVTSTPWPFTNTYKDGGGNWVDGEGFWERSMAVQVPLNEVKDGVNTITFNTPDSGAYISNINLILVNAANVP